MTKNLGIDGNKQGSKYFTDTRPRDKKGNVLPYPVALVANCVSYHRAKFMPLKTIYLKPRFFQQFVSWTKRMQSEEDAEKHVECYTFDGVEVKQQSRLRLEQMTWDFHGTKEIN